MRTALVSAIALALASASMASFAADQTTTQLPRDVRPSHYDVSIVPHAEQLKFDGKVSIAVEVLHPTTSITLNAAGMDFSAVTLTPKGKKALAAPKVAVNEDAQTATFTFAKPLPAGSYTLAMTYTGKIGTQANGLFAIDYDTTAGKKRALYTQFENSDARRFIPSWDEPDYKATFTLDVTVPSDQMAVSNMPAATTDKKGDGNTHVVFAPSPKMSTYLLFFGTGEFDRATTSIDGTEIGVIAQKGKADQANFALESSKAVLQEYNNYFGVKYPLPKLDNIASPGRSQFFSAMENWGAIFTFEYALLLDPSISTQSDKQAIFNTAAHEMAHQWFGDLVTMRWWDNLWLNEGFASWMAARTTEKLHPEWNAQLDAVYTREGAMSRDAIATTHPIVQNIDTVEQASQAFDTITYSKGEAVIRMLEGYVGADKWQQGVQRYIKAHAYGNTVSDDLWKEMDAVAGPGVTTIAHEFTLQPGVPLITVSAAKCEGGKTSVTFTQGEFTKDRPGKTPLRWHVPVIAKTVDGASVTTLVDGTASVSLPGCGPVLVNAGQSGYYRTLYPQDQFAGLRTAYPKLPAIDQMGMIGDAWALGLAGLEPVSNFLDLAKQVPVDAAPEMWGVVAGDLRSLDAYYKGDTTRQNALRKYAVGRLHPVFERVGWESKSSDTASVSILRSELIATLAQLGDKKVIDEARRRYAAQDTDPKAVPGELRKIITYVVASNADAATWDALHAKAKAETTPLVKDQLYTMLSIPQDDALAKRALELALTDEPGATNSADMIGAVSRNHPEMAFDFAVAHKAQVDKFIDSTTGSRFYPMLGGSSLDLSLVPRIEAFAKANIAENARRDSDTTIANIKYRSMVVRERLPSVDAWLKAQK